MSITNRLNYFTGFFTTARDWTEEQNYHIEKRKLHNRRLHSPGLIPGEGLELAIEAGDGLTVTVLQGAALDGEGNELYLAEPRMATLNPALYALPATVYIGLKYGEALTHLVQNMEIPQYSGYTRVTESVSLVVDTIKPDNTTTLELARIQLQEGATAVLNPVDPLNPQANEIDRRYVVRAGALGLTPEKLPFVTRERIIELMMRLRKDFAALDFRFAVPSSGDVRHGVLTVEMLARTDGITEHSAPGILASLGLVCRDAGQEIAVKYVPVSVTMEYDTFMQTVAALIEGTQDGEGLETLLNRMDLVGMAARELAELVLQLPVADGGPDLAISTSAENVLLTLDASNSLAFGGRTIERYHWRFSDIHSVPQADSGLDHTVFTTGENETVALDASASKAFGGKGIVRYHWTLRDEA